jgi:hypothetical protein
VISSRPSPLRTLPTSYKTWLLFDCGTWFKQASITTVSKCRSGNGSLIVSHTTSAPGHGWTSTPMAGGNAEKVGHKRRDLGKGDDRGGAKPNQCPKEAVTRRHTPSLIGVDHFGEGGLGEHQEEKLSGCHSMDLWALARISFIKVCKPTLKLCPLDSE